MRFPNLRYGIADELNHYAMGRSTKDIAHLLRRDERTVRDWQTGRRRVPWWVPELLRLRHMEAGIRHRQMGFATLAPRLGIVLGDVIEIRRPKRQEPQLTELRLQDFDQVRSTG